MIMGDETFTTCRPKAMSFPIYSDPYMPLGIPRDVGNLQKACLTMNIP